MADFITSGPIGFSGSYPGSVYSFITDAGGTVSTAGGISLSGLYASANTAEISLSGSATYASPYRMYNFYGMSSTAPSFGGGITQLGGDIDGEAAGDNFGVGISLNAAGTIFAAGAHLNDGGGSDAGHVRVFENSSATSSWSQLGSDIDGEAAGDWFGYSVSLNAAGTIFAAGARYNDGGGSDAGQVRVFEYSSVTSSWSQLGSDIDGEAAGDWFGIQLSLNAAGDIFAAGAMFNDGGGSDAGQVRVFEYSSVTSSWSQLGSDIDGQNNGEWLGGSVSLNDAGTIFAAGGIGNSTVNAGLVRVFEYSSVTSSWSQLGSDIDGEALNDWFGYSVSLNAAGTIFAAGAPKNDGSGTNAGHVRVFEYSSVTSSWSQLGSDIDGEAAGDQFGYAVSLNAAGNILAVGGPYNDGGGSDAGHIRIFEYSSVTSSWSQIGIDVNGEAAGDEFGFSVSLNAAGNVLGVGGPKNDAGGTNAGHVRVLAGSSPCGGTTVLYTPTYGVKLQLRHWITARLGHTDWVLIDAQRCESAGGEWYTELGIGAFPFPSNDSRTGIYMTNFFGYGTQNCRAAPYDSKAAMLQAVKVTLNNEDNCSVVIPIENYYDNSVTVSPYDGRT